MDTVGELVAELLKHDQNAKVRLVEDDYSAYYGILCVVPALAGTDVLIEIDTGA